MPLAGWQSLSPRESAHETQARLAALPPRLRAAAVAWVRPEAELAAQLGILRGIPYFLKDLFDLAGAPTKAGSRFLDRVRPSGGDAAIVRRLAEVGAIAAGKAQMVEFASGLTGENPHYGDCPHPRFPDRLTGGSSSGSAALVAAGVTPLAIGTDTGGSVRVPAAFCGLYGFRLTPGDAFIRDAFPLSPTMDTAGWFTAFAEDMRAVLPVLAGPTEPETGREPRGAYLPGSALWPDLDPAIERACADASAAFSTPLPADATATLRESWRNAVDAYLTIGMSEAHAVHRAWLEPHRADYDPVIWQRFHDAGSLPAEKIAAARAVLAKVRDSWAALFRDYDFLVLPSAPSVAPTKAECTPALRRAILALTAPASLGGLPCLAVPVPLPSGLSAGLQVVLPRATAPAADWTLARY